MGLEIERKFLVIADTWRRDAQGTPYKQGYLSTDPARTVRVRVKGDRGILTIKGLSQGASRPEYEYDIPIDDARALLRDLCHQPIIEKVRYLVQHGAHTWEVDVFEGVNAGLVVAEIELISEDEVFEKPDWAGDDVTDQSRYFNANLVAHPYSSWDDEERAPAGTAT